MRILSVVGARPNLIKIAPLVRELQRFSDVESLLLHTGQHYDDALSGSFFRELGIPDPQWNLGVGSGPHAWQTAQVMLLLEPIVTRVKPDLIVVVGDVNSTMAAALVGAKAQIPVAHVEAGLRSFDRTMPEEINRVVTDSLSTLLFATEPQAVENLLREGVNEENIYLVGNVMIDSLLRELEPARALQMHARLGVGREKYAVLTLHRPNNVDSAESLAGIFQGIGQLPQDMPIFFPVHPRTHATLKAAQDAAAEAGPNGQLRLMEPLGYREFIALMSDAALVITDSGGVQEETSVLGVRCVTVRNNTERPITVTHGTNIIGGTQSHAIAAAVRSALAEKKPALHLPDLWDGRAAERIVRILRERFGR